MKLVHEEEYKGLKIVIRATFEDKMGVRLNSDSKWHMGAVYLYGEIKEGHAKIVKTFDTQHDYDIGYDDYQITYKRVYKRTGILKLKKEYHIIHIKDEYEKVLPLFVERMKVVADDYRDEENRKKRNKETTDGLPDSLSGL